MLFYLLAALAGALAMFFLDPDRGTYRRNVTRDRVAGSARDVGAEVGRTGRKVASDAEGMTRRIRHAGRADAVPNDATLAHKIESELFRDVDIPKGDINVNVVEGVVYLRGQVDRADMIELIESRARRIDGVIGVQNLLHTSGSPAKHA